MTKNRLEAFSDGVIAILITIMVLELKVPHGSTWADIHAVMPVFLAYVLSFVNLGIYWNNHHHLLHTVDRVSGGILWANLHLLFWLSLVPFFTGWVGEEPHAPLPAALMGADLFLASVGYFILVRVIIHVHGPHSKLANAIGSDTKGKLSSLLYLTAIPLAMVHTYISYAIYAGVALMWLVPDRRIEGR